MEFDFGNILYIIVTIVAIVLGLAGKKKKPAGGNTSAPSRAAGAFLDQLGINLEELVDQQPVKEMLDDAEEADDESFEETVYAEEIGEVKAGEPEKSRFSDYEGFFSPESVANRFLISNEAIPVTAPIELIELDEETEKIDMPGIIGNFDLSKAVIYSEILNRKEY